MAIRLILAFVIAISFVSSCVLPAYYGEGGFLEGGTEIFGAELLLFGWMGLSLEVLPWLANPLFVVGFICYLGRKDAVACITSACSFAAALSLLVIMVPMDLRLVHPISLIISERAELRVAYLIWAVTPLILFAASSISYVLHIQNTQTQNLPAPMATNAPPA